MKYLPVSVPLSMILLWHLLGCSVDRSNNDQSWTHYGGSPNQSRYFKASEITKENVDQLEVAWFYPSYDDYSYQINPLIVDTIMYVLAKNHSLVALDARTGKEIWIHTDLRQISRRGFNHWESEDGNDKRILFTLGNSLQAIDAITGKSITSFGKNGYVDLREHLGRDPSTVRRAQSMMPGVIFNDLIILGCAPGEGYFSPPGYVRAYDIITGKIAWVFHTVPQPGEFGYETWPKEAYRYVGGTNVWSELTVDQERGIVFLPLGSPTYDFYGADRHGENIFGNCLVALNANTGERIWHYQTVHHDLWDYDLASAPQLITVNRNGIPIDAVAVATKQGLVFVFDRETGEPVFPIEEKPFPPSNMPEEMVWPTQPIPSLPAFTRHEVTKETLNPYFPDSIRQMWEERLETAQTGLYHPPSDQYELLIMPGSTGGANFGNTASDPKKGMLYVMAQEYGGIYRLEKINPPGPNLPTDQVPAVRNVFLSNCATCHGKEMLGGLGPSLKNIGQNMYYGQFEEILGQGKGRMPAFVHLGEDQIKMLYLYLGGSHSRMDIQPRMHNDQNVTIEGPVVDSGGIEMLPDTMFMPALRDYPEDVEHPEDRYRSNYGIDWPAMLTPPWSYIVAYDLNEGKINWKQPVGLDSMYSRGDQTMGAPGGVARKGMIITSSGIIFATAKGGQLYALDAISGKVLWKTSLSHESEGPPSMYAIDGKEYLVINATTDFGIGSYDYSINPGAIQKGYVVYSLPENTR